MSSIAASEVEGLALGQVRRLLASPDLVDRTLAAIPHEDGAVEDVALHESEVVEALGALEPVWDELDPAEQARILRLLIERSLVAELADQETPAVAAPWRLQSSDRARGTRSRHPDHPHPNAPAAPRGPEADHDAGGRGGAGCEATAR